MPFQIQPLESHHFEHLFALTETELLQQGIVQMIADEKPGFPCRLSLRDAEKGDTVLLLNYNHLPKPGPYQSSHAIFICKNGVKESQLPEADTVPPMIARLNLSLRAFDAEQMMLDGRLCQGTEADEIIRELLAMPNCAYVHIHSASRGCYLAVAQRS
ncbi:MAG: DUF1203 domain-containing protein [Idiomarina sp.]|nr:DUF1203 domain-containing protein [Idiomarina sp.]